MSTQHHRRGFTCSLRVVRLSSTACPLDRRAAVFGEDGANPRRATPTLGSVSEDLRYGYAAMRE